MLVSSVENSSEHMISLYYTVYYSVYSVLYQILCEAGVICLQDSEFSFF